MVNKMINTGRLAGRTLFITGASRGIGLAIAKKAAKDGANIVIAAKTTEAHAKLPGTIYTAAREIEEAGGQCLPCVVDIRNETDVKSAVQQAVEKFGGIDILVNNASAISLTGTMATSLKKYDLMNQVNARGTFLCSRECIEHLKKGQNPHILNISPPLNMNAVWFKGNVAYTMAKYGMSMCTLGMAEEFKADNVAVNALWPRTAVYTAAMEMIGGGESVADSCRKVEIMADAAYAILIKDSDTYTGHFAIDDEVLSESGITDLDQYAMKPGHSLLPDFFLDVDEPLEDKKEAAKETKNSGLAQTFEIIKGTLNEDLVDDVKAVYAFHLSGNEEGLWWIDLKTGSGSLGQGDPPTGTGDADVTFTMESEDFSKMFSGNLKPTVAFMNGKLKIKGDIVLAMKLEKIMGQMQAKL